MGTLNRILAASAAGALAYWSAKQVRRQSRRLDLRGKTVLITGGSRGLGLVMAREFAGRGASIAICARNMEELHSAADEFEARGQIYAAFQCDITDRAQVERLIAEVEATLGPIAVLVNNAGTITVGPIETMTAADYEEALRLHFWAPLYTSLAVLPSMRERNAGRIINIASIGGKIPVPHLAPYCASKYALVGLSECMRTELEKDNIFVTTVIPGLMRTGSPRNASIKGQYQYEFAWFMVSDSLPGLSISARSAARRIVDAAVHGDAELVLTAPAKLAVRMHGLAPELTSSLMALENRMLPSRPENWESGQGVPRHKGHEIECWITESPLTSLSRQAAEENNEIQPS